MIHGFEKIPPFLRATLSRGRCHAAQNCTAINKLKIIVGKALMNIHHLAKVCLRANKIYDRIFKRTYSFQ